MLSYNELVEGNLNIVYQVIKDQIRGSKKIGIFTYEDLVQIGRVGLCKAARSYKPTKAKFNTYAYTVIRNELFDTLEYASVHKVPETSEDFDVAMYTTPFYDEYEGEMGLESLLNTLQSNTTGIVSKGIKALLLNAQGLSYKEIGEMFNTTANNATAWASKARKYLLNNSQIIAMRESV